MKGFFEFVKVAVLFVTVAVVSAIIVMKVAMYTGGEEIKTPDLAGAPIIKALEIVDMAGLYLKVTSLEHSQNIPKDRVIAQSPEPGEIIKSGREVRVVISRGARALEMPDLYGTTEREMERLAAQSQLPPPKRIFMYAEGKERGITIAQKPAPGVLLHRGDMVTVVVSAGPPPRHVMVPKLEGARLDRAMRMLGQLGLKVSSVVYKPDNRASKGVVLSQEPVFGARAQNGSAVSLAVSEGPAEEAATVPSFVIFFYNLPDGGHDPMKVNIIQSSSFGDKEVYNRVHMPGDTVSLLLEIKGRTAVKVFLDNQLSEVKRY